MTPLEMSQLETLRTKERLAEAQEEIAELKRELHGRTSATFFEDVAGAFNLTGTETKLVLALYNAGRILGVNSIMDFMYGERDVDSEPETKIIHVFVCKVRKKMGADAIRSIWGRGYELTDIGRERLKDRVAMMVARREARFA